MRKKADKKIKAAALVSALMISSMAAIPMAAQAPSPRPRLVVGIMIDGLNGDYLELLRGYFGEGGFKRLMDGGVMLENVDFGTALDPTAATAVIYSGSDPSVNGIPSANIYDPVKRLRYPVLLDTDNNNSSNDNLSPKAIRVSTLSDEVRIDGGGIGNSYAISPSPTQAVVMAGHAGNSAFWINDVTGRWSTTSYYKDVPPPITGRNFSTPLANRLDTLTWRPSLAPADYPDLPAYKKYYPFRHMFQRNDKNRFRNFKTAAPVNTEVTDVAVSYIKGLELGKHQAMDMLNVAYTLAPFSSAKDADNRLETMDSYLKLDDNLSRLFRLIDEQVGLGNTFIMVAGTPQQPSEKRDDEKWGVPCGEFSPKRAISLLNVYFMAKYGQAEWVTGYDSGQIYLNRALIKERDIDLKEMREDAAGFLVRMTGVSGAWSADEVVAGRAGTHADALKRNTCIDIAGDVFIEINPGWEIVTTDPNTQEEQRTTVRSGLMAAPVFLYSKHLAPVRISEETDARAIAPTVARLLRIRSPNASALAPLHLPKR